MKKRILIFLGIVVTGLFLYVFITLLSYEDPLDTTLREIKSSNFSGAILVANGDKVIRSSGYGYASCDTAVPNTENTVFAIGSITKMFTAVAIGQLDEAGKLNIDHTIDTYFDDVPADKTAITIRHLLDHTSGLRPYHETQDRGDFESMDQQTAFTEIMRRSLLFSPGEGEEYSNSGYTLLALLIERTSGQSYTDYIRGNILTPANMDSTGFWGESFSNIASTSNQVLGCSSPDSWEYSWVLVGNGGMVSTIGDLHRWVMALNGDDILSKSAKKRLGYNLMLNIGFGDAGGSSQHQFNAALYFLGPINTTIVAISNRNTLPAEEAADLLLPSAFHELYLPHR